jgi:hypothetical protein
MTTYNNILLQNVKTDELALFEIEDETQIFQHISEIISKLIELKYDDFDDYILMQLSLNCESKRGDLKFTVSIDSEESETFDFTYKVLKRYCL